MTHSNRQSGGVSMFLVIFASLLMIVISVSFVQLMLQEQKQASANDLSQSALDSAQAGVEDAKRLLLLQQSCDNGTVPSGYASRCGAVTTAINSKKCNTVAAIFGDATDKETKVQQTVDDTDLQQAYTCVKFVDALDYQGQLTKDSSTLIPLRAVANFNSVKISWFTDEDITSGASAITFPSTGGDVTLPRIGTLWPVSAPALIRTQFIQTGANFTLADFDNKQAGGESDANTVFLYPLRTPLGLTSIGNISNTDARRVASGEPQGIRCNTTFTVANYGGYACSVTIGLSNYDGANATRNAFLRLSALYNGAHYAIELYNGANPVAFDGVQSIIDSTGRANDTFRRIITRVHLGGEVAYPEAAVDVTNNICKNFSVTDDPGEYIASGCDPTKNS